MVSNPSMGFYLSYSDINPAILIGLPPKQQFQNIYIDFVFSVFVCSAGKCRSVADSRELGSFYIFSVSHAGAVPVPTIVECGEV